MAALAERLDSKLAAAAAAAGLPFSCRRIGSLLNVYFTPEAPSANLVRDDAEIMRLVHLAGMNHGLYFASRGLLVLSTVMHEAFIDDAAARFAEAFTDVANER